MDSVDLTGYATETFVTNKIEEASLGSKVDLSGYATKADLNNKANVSHTHTKSDITDLSIPTKTSQLTNDSGFIVSIPSEYVTETELSAKGYATETYVQNKIAEASLSGGEVDLSGYATKDDLNTKADKTAIPTKVSQLTNDKGYLTSIPSEYVTETELSAKGYLTDHQDISMKADKTELHSHSNKTVLDEITSTKVTEWNNKSNFDGNYNSLTNKPTIPTVDVNKSYVDTELSKKSDKTHNHDTVYAPINHEHSQYLTSVPSEYVTDEELNAKGYLTSHQDISGKADKSYVDTQLSKKSDTTHNHSYNDLTDKPTIPSAYTLPAATSTTLGGIKVGSGLTINNGVLSTTNNSTGNVDGTVSSSSLNLGIINVKDYGAVGDGSTDDTAAIKSAIAAMCAKATATKLNSWRAMMPVLFFPEGRYVISEKGALNCQTSAVMGYNIKGAGYHSTEIYYTYDSASDSDGGYLLVNGSTENNWFGFSYIEDISIRGANGTQNFWQVKSREGSPQANRFSRVCFFDLNNCVTVTYGTQNYNADLFRFESCRCSEISGHVFGVEGSKNSQSVVHTFRDCDFENITGKVIEMYSGGTIEVRGGSWIAKKNGRFFHFDDTSGSGIGLSNRNISIYGTKFEYQYYDNSDSNTDYYTLFYNNSRMIMYFYGCNMTQFGYTSNAANAKANYGYIGIMGSVNFFNCQIPKCLGIKTDPTLSVALENIDQRPMIKFKDCLLYDTLDKIVSQVSNNEYQGGAYTDVIAEDCYYASTGSSNAIHVNTQLNQAYGNRAIPTKKKMVVLTRSTNFITSLPCGGNSFTYAFPKDSIITDITIYFRKLPGVSTSYTINITNSNGSVLATGTHIGSDANASIKTEVFEVVESDSYLLTITGTGENSNGGIGGFVAVEYY